MLPVVLGARAGHFGPEEEEEEAPSHTMHSKAAAEVEVAVQKWGRQGEAAEVVVAAVAAVRGRGIL